MKWVTLVCLLGCSSAPRTASPPPATAPGLVYQVFVRSFQDSNGDGNGDLTGLLQRLDTIQDGQPGGDDLGAGALWLMPIHPSPSYHGYDVTDFRDVHPDYGNLQQVDALLSAAHARGMRVYLDLVLNHTSSEHPWFRDAAAGGSRRGWYRWRKDNPGWKQPWNVNGDVWHPLGAEMYYALFWKGMPDLNYANPQVVEELTGVARFWLRRGVDGFRIDAARHIVESDAGVLVDQPATHAFFKAYRKSLEAVRKDVTLIAEAWADRPSVNAYFGNGDEFHQAFDFDLAQAVVWSVGGEHAGGVREQVARIQASGVPWSYEATFLSNHDLERLASRLPSSEAAKAALSVLLALPGTPFIYAGDELGVLQGSGPGDEPKRTPMPWDATGGFTTGKPWFPYSADMAVRNRSSQLEDPASLLRHVQWLVQTRQAHPAFADDSVQLPSSEQDEVLPVIRGRGAAMVMLIINLSAEPVGGVHLKLPSQTGSGVVDWTLDGTLPPYGTRLIMRW